MANEIENELADIIENKRTIKVANQDVTLDPSRLLFTDATLTVYQEREHIYYDYFGGRWADAEAELQFHSLKVEAVYAQKFIGFKDEGGSDKLAEARVKADPEYQEACKNAMLAKLKVRLLQQHLRAWDKAHENSQSKGHMQRKEMDKFNAEVYAKTHEVSIELDEQIDNVIKHGSEE